MASTPINLEEHNSQGSINSVREANHVLQGNGSWYRKKHLPNSVDIAKRAGNEVVAQKIFAFIESKRQRAFLRRLNYTCGKKKVGSPTTVQVQGRDDKVLEHASCISRTRAEGNLG